MDRSYSDSDDSRYFQPQTQKRKAIKIVNKRSKQQKLTHEICKTRSAHSKTDSPKGTSVKNKDETDNKEVTDFTPNESPQHCSRVDKLDEGENSQSGQEDNEKNLEANSPSKNVETSAFFKNMKPVDQKIKLSCPLCLKVFDNTNSHISHMKQCAKKKKLSTQQLLNAVELHRKQQEERHALGLTQIQSDSSKKPSVKKKSETLPDRENQFELAMALAMSRSLQANGSKSNTDPFSSSVIESQKTTLEKFGFTSSCQNGGKKKLANSRSTILRDRSKEDREKLMTEKAAAVLLDEDQSEQVQQCQTCQQTQQPGETQLEKNKADVLHSAELNNYYVNVPHLWSLAERDGGDWYIEDVKAFFDSDKSEGNLKHIEMQIQEEQNEDIQSNVQSEDLQSNAQNDDIEPQIALLDLPKKTFNDDWKKLINNKVLSDVVLNSKDGLTVYVHTVVIFARCQNILDSDYKQVLEDFNLDTIVQFLHFLYCGVLVNLKRCHVDSLMNLAEALHYQELIEVLLLLKDNLLAESASSSEGIIPSSLSPPALPQSIKELAPLRTDGGDSRSRQLTWTNKDLDQPIEQNELVDLTQSSHGSSETELPEEEEEDEEESNLDKSYWSFIEHERNKTAMEELRRKEEEKENIMNTDEMRKIETIMRQQTEMNQMYLDEMEREDQEVNLKNKMELEKIYNLSKDLSGLNDDQDLFEDELKPKHKHNPDFILISSDSENSKDPVYKQTSKSSPTTTATKTTITAVTPTPTTVIRSSPTPAEDEDTQNLFERSRAQHISFEVPYFDPYDDIHMNVIINSETKITPEEDKNSPSSLHSPHSANNLQSQSLLMGHFSPLTSKLNRSSTVRAQDSIAPSPSQEGPAYCSTPLSARRLKRKGPLKRENSVRKCVVKSKKRQSEANTNKSLREFSRRSLRISRTSRSSRSRSLLMKKSVGRKSETDVLAKVLTDSIVNELNKSMSVNLDAGNSVQGAQSANLTLSNRKTIEVTPRASAGVEYCEKVTPLPDYSAMENTLLKKHLSKYGLKKSLRPGQAKKILRHIYEELHPVLNTRTGKIVKVIPTEKPKKKTKNQAKAKKTSLRKKKNEGVNPKSPKKNSQSTPQKASPISKKCSQPEKDDLNTSDDRETVIFNLENEPADEDRSIADSLDRSTEYDSDGSEFDLDEKLSQPLSGTDWDISMAVHQYLESSPEIYRKILLYEPIWLEALRDELHINYNKKFKLSELMDYLDKMCITFRSEAQKKNNEKKNEAKKSPRKKQISVKK